MIAYCINGMGGKEASGIPSLDAAVSIAIDWVRYDDYANDGDDEPWRRDDITVEDEPYEYKDGSFKMVYVHGRDWYGIHEETRCDHCLSILPYRGFRD